MYSAAPTLLASVGRRVLPVVAVLVCWLGMSGTASASCGDYVLVNGVPMARPGHDHGSMPTGDLPGGSQCHGPLCQQGKLPPAPLPKIVVDDQRIECVIAVEANPNGDLVSRLPLANGLVQARDAVSDVFHPPRHSA